MNKFEKLCQTASDIDVDIVDYPFTSDRFKGLYCDGTIALNQDICADSEKACILAEELGHHFTTVGNITDQKETENRKQERRARVWAYNEMISLSDLVDSYKDGCRSRYEIAEHLDAFPHCMMLPAQQHCHPHSASAPGHCEFSIAHFLE